MHRLRLTGTVFEAETNVYLFREEPITLVDAGVGTEDCERQLRSALEREGVALSAVDRVVLTHFHFDHAGLASTIQRESDATVYSHPDDAPLVTAGADGFVEAIESDSHVLERWGVPLEERTSIKEVLGESASMGGGPVDVTPIEDGERIDAGDHTMTVRHVPGHTAGHVAVDLGDGTVLAGDCLHPQKTPNIGGDIRLEHSLSAYLASLERLLSSHPRVIWPGHGEAIRDPIDRGNRIAAHHRRRAERMWDALDDETYTSPWTVARAVFGELSGIHALNGTGESAAHLAFLESAGLAEEDNGCYRRNSETDSLADAFPQFS